LPIVLNAHTTFPFVLLHCTQVLCQSRFCKSDHVYYTYLMINSIMFIILTLCYSSSLIGLTVTKFKPLIFSASGFLFYAVNMFILMIFMTSASCRHNLVVVDKLKVPENSVLRRTFGLKRNEVIGEWQHCIMGSFITCILCQVKFQ
jgi:hypothetical protein